MSDAIGAVPAERAALLEIGGGLAPAQRQPASDRSVPIHKGTPAREALRAGR